MNTFQIKQSPKTKLLNVFRRLLAFPAGEQLLFNSLLRNPRSIARKFVPPDYLYKKGAYRKISRDGINYQLDISNVVDHYLYFGLETFDYVKVVEDIQKASVILDIGANIGTTSLYFAAKNPNAKIFSFEPHPDTFKRAEENISINKFRNIHLINLGLGEEPAVVKLYEVNEHNPGMNRILKEELDLPFKEIKIDRLDTVLESKGIDKVDFIKIDVEGFEYSVLKGGEKVLRHKPALFIELDDNNLRQNGHSAAMLIGFLAGLGYTQFLRADTNQELNANSDFSNCHYDITVR